MKKEQLTVLESLCEGHVFPDEPMNRHTTFRVGGPADALVCPESEEELCQLLGWCRREGIPSYIIGNGSNLLVSDEGVRGVVIQLFKNYSAVSRQQETLLAQAGARLSVLAHEALEGSLTGLEFASGIPGTLGGAVTMNAGAYGGEMKDVLTRVRVLQKDGSIYWMDAADLELGYRTSRIQKEGGIVLEAELRLAPGERDRIAQRMEELKEQRVTKQPLDLPSAGSTFKRPEGYFAGKLIMDAVLRGYTVGGAQVSDIH